MKIEWQEAGDIKKRLFYLIKETGVDGIKFRQIKCFRSKNAQTRATARIWGLSRIWQQALKIPPYYIIEVVSEKFDKLSQAEQDKILFHELAHIPGNFSGALLAHTRRGKKSFRGKLRKLYESYNSARRSFP